MQLMNSAPSSASDADDMTELMILEMVNTAPLLVGNAVLLDVKKLPPALLLYFFREVRGVAVDRWDHITRLLCDDSIWMRGRIV